MTSDRLGTLSQSTRLLLRPLARMQVGSLMLIGMTGLTMPSPLQAQNPTGDPLSDTVTAEEPFSFLAAPSQSFRTGLGALWLTPLSDEFSHPGGRLPSGRVYLTTQLGPVLGFQLGGLRLAANRTRGVDASNNDLKEQLALTVGLTGFRFNVTRGRIRAAPYLEFGGGLLQAQVDSGGYNFPGGYEPDWREISNTMLGGGAGLGLDLIVGPGLTLSGQGGYSYYLSPSGSVSPIKGLQAGFGLSWTFRNPRWYWRTSGADDAGPGIRVWSPAPSPNGVIDAGANAVNLELLASDLSGVDSVRIGTQIMVLDEAPKEREPEDPAAGHTSLARATLLLRNGTNYFDVVAYDGAENQTVHTLRVRGMPLDEVAPDVELFDPAEDAQLEDNRTEVVGVVFDAVDVREVEVNGIRARLAPATTTDRLQANVPDNHVAYRFSANVPLNDGRNVIRVVATDTMSNEGGYERFVNGPRPAGLIDQEPIIDIIEPGEWAGTDPRGIGVIRRSSIRVSGVARYAQGIQELNVDGVPATLQLNPNGTSANFDAFVAMEDQPREVVVRAVGADGVSTARTFSVRPVDRVGRANPVPMDAGRRRWAIVIGVSEYLDDRIPDLDYADEDAVDFYGFLRSPSAGLGGIPEENIMYLVNEDATERNIRTALQTFLRQSTEDDVIMVYIAAHGMPDPQRPDDMYLLAHDTDLDNLPVTAIDMGLVQQAVRDAFSYNTIVFTDACHSGAVGDGTRVGSDNNRINEVFLDRMGSSTGGVVMFTASETNQLSQESDRWGGGHGAFTHYLLEGLQGQADENGDGIVELGELMEFTRDRVRRDTNNAQVPSISNTQFDRFWPMSLVTGGAERTPTGDDR